MKILYCNNINNYLLSANTDEERASDFEGFNIYKQ